MSYKVISAESCASGSSLIKLDITDNEIDEGDGQDYFIVSSNNSAHTTGASTETLSVLDDDTAGIKAHGVEVKEGEAPGNALNFNGAGLRFAKAGEPLTQEPGAKAAGGEGTGERSSRSGLLGRIVQFFRNLFATVLPGNQPRGDPEVSIMPTRTPISTYGYPTPANVRS